MTFGESARLCRKEAGMSMKELARKSGVSSQMIWFIETDRKCPSLITLEALADTLGLSLDEYVGHEVKGRKK